VSEEIKTLINVAAVVMALSLITGGLLLALAIRQVKKIRVPANAGLVATLQGTPLLVVLGLDLLDLALDILAAPVSWVVLDYLGLRGLRTVTVIEALIPGTQLFPTLTVTWIASRLMPDRLSLLVQEAEAHSPLRGERAP
jgi:ABC-type amino acid transport system permease subunit